MTTTEQKENLLERAHIVAIETEASANDANRIGTLFGDIINGMGDGLTENDEDDYTDAHTLRTDKSQNLTSAEKARALQNLGIPGIATGGDFDNPTPTQRAKVPTVGAILDTGVMEGYVYDVTAMNSGTTFASLEALLSSEHLNDYIPVAKRKGGMSIKFVLSFDNNYVQFRYMSSSIAVEDFTNVANWQGVDDMPTPGSKNFVESGIMAAVYGYYTKSPEFIEVILDADDRIIYGIKKDGDVVFGVGVPNEIKKLVLAERERAIGEEERLDSIKVDKAEGKSLIEETVANNIKYAYSQEYLDVKTDSEGRILEGTKSNGEKVFNTEVTLKGVTNIFDNSYYSVQSIEWLRVILDNDNKIILGIRTNGDVFFGAGVPKQIVDYIDGKSSKEVEAFLDGYLGGSATLSQIIEDINDSIESEETRAKTAEQSNANTLVATQQQVAALAGSSVFTRSEVETIVEDKIASDWDAPTLTTRDRKTEWDIIFAAQDSSAADQAMADYVCTSTNAQDVIQTAIDNWYANNNTSNCGNFLFCDGTYYMTHFIEPTGDDANAPFYCIRMPRGIHSNAAGTLYPTECRFSGVHRLGKGKARFLLKTNAYIKYADNTTGQLIDWKDDSTIYQAADEYGPGRYLNDYKRFAVFRCIRRATDDYGGANWCSYKMTFENLKIQIGDELNSTLLRNYPIIAIDAIHSSALEVNYCELSSVPTSQPIYYYDALNEGFTGIRCMRGQQWGYQFTMKSISVFCFYHGIEHGSEHSLLEDVNVRYCYFGISRGTYHDPVTEGSTAVAGTNHLNVMADCAIERCMYHMGFFANGAGWCGGGVWSVVGLSLEWALGQGTADMSRGCFVEKRIINGTTVTNYPYGTFEIQGKPWVEPSDGYGMSGIDRQFFSLRTLTNVSVKVLTFMFAGTTGQYQSRVGEHGQIVYNTTTNKWMIWNNRPSDAGEHSSDDYTWGDSPTKMCYYGKWEELN